MPYMRESDNAVWICGDGDKSIGYIGGVACTWYGPAEIMPHMEYERSREDEVFECIDGAEYICRADGWQELDKYTKMEIDLEREKKEAIWV